MTGDADAPAVVALPPSSPEPTPGQIARFAGRERAAWLVLANGGPAAALPELAATKAVSVTADPRRFRDILLAERPRIVVVCQPPAGDEDLDLVASERRRRPRLRALHLAPPGAVADRIGALSRGFDDALTTTTTASELVGRLERSRLDAREGAVPGSTLPIGDGVELDLVARELRRDGLAIHLRPKEFGLLALMVVYPGVRTPAEILERVWGRRHREWLRTVDVHVRWLRTKIEAEP